MQVVFSLKDDWYVSRIEDTEVRIFYDDKSWHLHWTTYSSDNECVANWWCEKLDCSLDDLDEDNMDDDEYCFECPREFVETIDNDSYTSDSWSEQPTNLEEARKLILKLYNAGVPHNGLTRSDDEYFNEHFYDTMHGTWFVET